MSSGCGSCALSGVCGLSGVGQVANCGRGLAGVGQAPEPYRHLTEVEQTAFLDQYWTPGGPLQQYSITRDPPWGFIYTVQGLDLLVWIDATDNWHVIDVTAAPALKTSVNEAPYRSPDDVGFWSTFTKDFKAATTSTAARAETALYLVAGIVALAAIRDVARAAR